MSITVFYLKNEPKDGRHDPVWMAITVPVRGEAETAERDAAALAAFDNGHYEAVAKSTSSDYEDVWTSLQNGIRSPSWSMNPPPGIEPLGETFSVHNGQKYGNRSSSVGDIFRDDATGELHIVASFGFDTLKRAEPA
jgi:hypothetical protein